MKTEKNSRAYSLPEIRELFESILVSEEYSVSDFMLEIDYCPESLMTYEEIRRYKGVDFDPDTWDFDFPLVTDRMVTVWVITALVPIDLDRIEEALSPLHNYEVSEDGISLLSNVMGDSIIVIGSL